MQKEKDSKKTALDVSRHGKKENQHVEYSRFKSYKGRL